MSEGDMNLKIYLDYVFFINFLFDFILLLGISMVLKRNAKISKIVLGSFFGGLSTFILFFNLSSWLFFVLKILSGIIMLIITFNFKDIRYTFLNLIYLMILSIILGGALYLINIEVGYQNVGMIFFTNGKSVNIFILILCAILIMLIYTKVERRYKKDIKFNYEVNLYVKHKKLRLNGFIDTGNSLYDPYFNKPILILNKNFSLDGERFVLVPFKTINSDGLMKCYFVDKVDVKGLGIVNNCLVGISPDNIEISGIDIILHKDLWEEKE